MTAYCLTCRQIVEIVDSQVVEMRNGRLALEGYCPNDDSLVYRFISERDAEEFE